MKRYRWILREDGIAMLEFALIAPILLVAMVAIAELGIIFIFHGVLLSARTQVAAELATAANQGTVMSQAAIAEAVIAAGSGLLQNNALAVTISSQSYQNGSGTARRLAVITLKYQAPIRFFATPIRFDETIIAG